jgi:hypothetical protein
VNLATVRRNPVAVTITLPDGSRGCLAINDALIDQQTTPRPPRLERRKKDK